MSNTRRARHLADTGLQVLAEAGARGLTHRAVDRAAGEPGGTTSNYFRSRSALLGALADRIFERLQPPAEPVNDSPTRTAGGSSGEERYIAYLTDVVRRVTAQPTLWLALVELRLEATRSPDLAVRLSGTMTRTYSDDIALHRSAGFSGGDLSVSLLHFAIDGLLLDILTPSIEGGSDPGDTVRVLVQRLAAPPPASG